jgi:hypothetical protein
LIVELELTAVNAVADRTDDVATPATAGGEVADAVRENERGGKPEQDRQRGDQQVRVAVARFGGRGGTFDFQ